MKNARSSEKGCSNPSLYQINTAVSLGEISRKLGRRATLDDMPDEWLDQLASKGFDWLWFLGVWQTGRAGQQVSRNNPVWLDEYRQVLPDLRPEDIRGSCFAITSYKVHTDFGGNAALKRLRERIHQRGMRLLLDFVPNHTALDHPWVEKHPNFYMAGSEQQLREKPRNYIRIGSNVFAYGRDPYFDGWPDTLQLNYAEPALQEAMRAELKKVASLCDGVRCDMAMLILPDVFERTWGARPEPFWLKTIDQILAKNPEFLFMAEVYWDLEWTLQQQGFHYTYDKRLYDRLHAAQAMPVRDHLRADPDFQRRSARFLENHDEPRAAATFPFEIHKPAAVLTFLCQGLRFFHDGQLEGRTKRVPVHLGRRPDEPVDQTIASFYDRLLSCIHHPSARDGRWQLLECAPAWEGNRTSECFICSCWNIPGERQLVVITNFAPNQSQCYLPLPFEEMSGCKAELRDLMSEADYEREGSELQAKGLYLDLPAWGYHVFELGLRS